MQQPPGGIRTPGNAIDGYTSHMVRFILVLMLFVESALAATSDMPQPSTSLPPGLNTSSVETAAKVDPSLDALGSLQLPLADWAQIRDRIRARAAMCDSCHATALHQGNDYLPVLQGQNREYLYLKIKSFAEDSRSRHPFPAALANGSRAETGGGCANLRQMI